MSGNLRRRRRDRATQGRARGGLRANSRQGIERRLLVALHDVTPAHRDRIVRVLGLLDELGIAKVALLVVPNWHGEWPLDEHPDFVEELRRRQAAGAEVLLHGYRHDEVGHTRTLVDRVRIFGRTARSAEFMMLDRDEAAARIDRGQELLLRMGLHPVGFVPPAWLFGRDTLSLIRERGLGLTEGFWNILGVSSRRRLFAPVLSWSTARPWRSGLTAGIAAVRRPIERHRSIVRVAVHPPDIDVPVVAKSLERSLGALLSEREVVGYGEVLRV